MDAVLNWLWQGGVVAVTSGVTLFALQRAGANVRYIVCWATLALIVALPALPAVLSTAPSAGAFLPTQTDAVVSLPDAWWTSTLVILAAWMVWASIQLVRFVSAIVAIRRARARQPSVPAAPRVRPAALEPHPLRGPARHARAVQFGDERGCPRMGSADDRRRPVAREDARSR